MINNPDDTIIEFDTNVYERACDAYREMLDEPCGAECEYECERCPKVASYISMDLLKVVN